MKSTYHGAPVGKKRPRILFVDLGTTLHCACSAAASASAPKSSPLPNMVWRRCEYDLLSGGSSAWRLRDSKSSRAGRAGQGAIGGRKTCLQAKVGRALSCGELNNTKDLGWSDSDGTVCRRTCRASVSAATAMRVTSKSTKLIPSRFREVKQLWGIVKRS
jgi:hypothetical protein